MKIKLGKIVTLFNKKNQIEQPLLIKVLDTIIDFERKMMLKPAFREIKRIYEDYKEEEQNFVKKLIKEFCDNVNKEYKDNPEFKKLIPDQITRIPDQKISDYNKEITKRLDVEVELKENFLLYRDEIERAKLAFSEEELLIDFVDWENNKPNIKKNKPQKSKK